ncbi:MAG: cytochrome c peroxidase [Gemmatimonadales bacterium]
MRRAIFGTRTLAGLTLIGLVLAGCSTPDAGTPLGGGSTAARAVSQGLVDTVRILAAGRHITPLASPPPVRIALVTLGQALAFDKVLSGNRDISCMTCHLPALGTGDGRSLSIGQGATGLGTGRVHPLGLFIPRNAPPLFNLGAVQSLFLDGRVSRDSLGRFHSPAGTKLNRGMTAVFEFGALSALPLFPVLSREEMRAFSGNELAAVPDVDMGQIWSRIMVRLGQIPEYRRMFEAAYPGTNFNKMTFAHASNAIAGFLTARLGFNNSPWDRFLAGDNVALTQEQLVGAQTFLSLKCSICHNGPAFSDNQFHNVAVAQFGPGKGNGAGGNDDFGRFNEQDKAAMRYTFRTPALRNVVLTAPYGHDGAIMSLRDFIAHYSESDLKLRAFDPMTLEPLLQGAFLDNVEQVLLTRDTLLNGVVIPDIMVDQLTEFMGALTDDPANYPSVVPARVPSGLPIDNP